MENLGREPSLIEELSRRLTWSMPLQAKA